MRFLPVFSFGAVYAAAAKAVRREKMRARHFTNFAHSAKLYGIFAERKATHGQLRSSRRVLRRANRGRGIRKARGLCRKALSARKAPCQVAARPRLRHGYDDGALRPTRLHGHGRRLFARDARAGTAEARRDRSPAAAFVPVDAAAQVVGKGRRRHLLPRQHQLSDASAQRAAHVCPPA